ncbi:synaptotagmin-2-like isoform X1 [Lates japonicus]|uniref:Synaptotagmin n=1 Tax=Lates japonicus TaxID=270547 RepID=A0AAD3RC71_LATJO|nr:synaptotagmin-2-like isoform X1 [Lates japonicus]
MTATRERIGLPEEEKEEEEKEQEKLGKALHPYLLCTQPHNYILRYGLSMDSVEPPIPTLGVLLLFPDKKKKFDTVRTKKTSNPASMKRFVLRCPCEELGGRPCDVCPENPGHLYLLRYVPIKLGKLTACILEAKNLKKMDARGLSDPYVKIQLLQGGKTEEKKTTVKKNTQP